MTTTATPEEIPFGEAYEELKAITAKLNNEEVGADQLVEILSRGKGLEAACREHLAGIEQEIQEIESGKGVKPIKIVPVQSAEASHGGVPTNPSDFVPGSDVPEDNSDFQPPAPSGGTDDDIPF